MSVAAKAGDCGIPIATSKVVVVASVIPMPPGTGTMPDNRLAPLPELDRRPHERAVLGPRAVVVLHVLVAEELLKREPRVGGALPDPAVGDHLALARDPLGRVELAQLVSGLECPVLVRCFRTRDVRRARDMESILRPLMGQMIGRDHLSAELLGRAYVHELRGAGLLSNLVAKSSDLQSLGARRAEPRRLVGRRVLG